MVLFAVKYFFLVYDFPSRWRVKIARKYPNFKICYLRLLLPGKEQKYSSRVRISFSTVE